MRWLPGPAVGFVGEFGDCGAVVLRVLSASALGRVVVEEPYGKTSQHNYGGEVAERHQPHEDIGKAPREFERCYRADHHHGADSEPVGGHGPAAFAYELEVGFAVVVIRHNACECEQKHCHSHES